MSLFDNKVECNDGTFSISNGAVAPCIGSGVKTLKSQWDFTKLKGWTGGANPNGMYTKTLPSTKVLCNDGSIQFQTNDPNARVMDACAKNGGRSANQPIDFTKHEEEKFKLALEQKKLDAEKAMSDAEKSNKKEPIYYILVTAGVMIASYFAYKKLKK